MIMKKRILILITICLFPLLAGGQALKGSYFSEFSYGSFKRTVALPWDLRFDDAAAEFDNGVLTVIIPKSQDEKGKKRKIEINRK